MFEELIVFRRPKKNLLSRNLEFRDSLYKSLILSRLLNQMNPLHTFASCLGYTAIPDSVRLLFCGHAKLLMYTFRSFA
jgi:hypothetical protein